MTIDLDDLSRLRSDLVTYTFFDLCKLLRREVTGTNEYGLPTTTEVESEIIPCRITFNVEREVQNQVQIIDALLRLPFGTDITGYDRIKLIARSFQEITPPMIFSIDGPPDSGPLAITIKLQRIGDD